MKISFLILLFSISTSIQAGDRLEGISGAMGNSSGLFSKLFGNDTKNEDSDVDTSNKRQRAEITVETKREAERDAAQIKEGERHDNIQDDSANFLPEQENKTVVNIPEIDIFSDINAEFEDTMNKLEVAEPAHKRPTQLFVDDSGTLQTINKASPVPVHASNEIAAIQVTGQDCVKEKVYSLDVENTAQYERLEDFPFTYECVIQR